MPVTLLTVLVPFRHRAARCAVLLLLLTSPVVQAMTAMDGCPAIDISGPPYDTDKPGFSPFDGVPAVVRDPSTHIPVRLNQGGINLYMPTTEFPDQDLLACGFLDVTKPPFYADASGNEAAASSNAAAFRDALEAGRHYMLAVFVPAGTYYIDDTIECAMGFTADLAEQGDRQGACLLVGSRAAAERPLIKVSSAAPVFADVDAPAPMLHFWARAPRFAGGVTESRPQRLYHSGAIGIDFDTNGLPGAFGLQLAGAQGSMLEDVHVQATGSVAGIRGVPSAGGTVANVGVTGGQIGIDLITGALGPNISQMPVLVGMRLVGQTRHALQYSSYEALSLVGSQIVVPPESTGPAVYASHNRIVNASMMFVDVSIEFEAPAQENVAVTTNRGLYLRDTYVHGAGTIARADDGDELAGNDAGWRHVNEYVTTPPGKNLGNLRYELPIYMNGIRQFADIVDLNADDEPPPSDLRSRHLYDEATFPHWEMAGAVNIKRPPYNARGDYVTDDTEVIQRAIDDGHEFIFFPKGTYGVSETIHLRPDTKLVGAARHLSLIVARDDPGSSFKRDHDPNPVIESADDPNGTAMMAHIGLYNPMETAGAYNFLWRTGKHSILRDVNNIHERVRNGPVETSHLPMMRFSGNAGGKVYGQYRFDLQTAPSGTYRVIKIEETREPLTFYQFNLENKGNAGITEAELNDVQNVAIFAFKDEANQQMYLVRDSSRFSLYGTGGFSRCGGYQSCIEIFDSTDYRVVGALKRGYQENPPVTSMIREVSPTGVVTTTSLKFPVERPMLFGRGGLWRADD